MSCPMEGPTWQGTEGGLQPTAMRKWESRLRRLQRTEAFQQPREWTQRGLPLSPAFSWDYSPTNSLTAHEIPWAKTTQLSHFWIHNSQKLWKNKFLLFSAAKFGGNLLCSDNLPRLYPQTKERLNHKKIKFIICLKMRLKELKDLGSSNSEYKSEGKSLAETPITITEREAEGRRRKPL